MEKETNLSSLEEIGVVIFWYGMGFCVLGSRHFASNADKKPGVFREILFIT
jgi:hypothetical protein